MSGTPRSDRFRRSPGGVGGAERSRDSARASRGGSTAISTMRPAKMNLGYIVTAAHNTL